MIYNNDRAIIQSPITEIIKMHNYNNESQTHENTPKLPHFKRYWKLYLAIIFFGPIVLGLSFCGIATQILKHTGTGISHPVSLAFAKACSNDGICLDKVILVRGEITDSSYAAFTSWLSKNNQTQEVDIICFDSPGGSNQSAMPMGKYISDRGYKTCLADRYELINPETTTSSVETRTLCNSMCPYIYAAGRERLVIGSSVKFGFHATGKPCFPCGKFIPPQTDMSAKESFIQQLDLYKANGSPAIHNAKQLVDITFEVDFKTIKYMSKKSEKSYNLVTRYL